MKKRISLFAKAVFILLLNEIFVRMIFAERKFAGTGLKNLTKKVSIDQLLIGPMLLSTFFAYNERK
jgi:hypothetical protein